MPVYMNVEYTAPCHDGNGEELMEKGMNQEEMMNELKCWYFISEFARRQQKRESETKLKKKNLKIARGELSLQNHFSPRVESTILHQVQIIFFIFINGYG